MRRLFTLALMVAPAVPLVFAAPMPAAPTTAPAKPAAAAKAGEKNPESVKGAPGTPSEVLASKGLTKAGDKQLLKTDKDLADAMKAIAQARVKMNYENKDRVKIEKNIKKAKDVFAHLEFERRGLLQKLANVKDAGENNRLVAKIEQITSQMKEAVQYKEDQEKELAKIGEDDKTKYINLILDTSAEVEKAEKEYAALGADADVKSALEQTKTKLGPSPEFVTNAAALKRLRGTVSSDTIDVKMENGVPMVQVTLNKSFTREMVFDSGASIIAIPADLAKAMELIPAKDDPTVRLRLADGKVVEAKLTMLKSVRVGSFTIENVEAAVLPPELVAAEPLLGGSFLQHFVYKLDPKSAKLHLAQVGTGDPAKKPALPK